MDTSTKRRAFDMAHLAETVRNRRYPKIMRLDNEGWERCHCGDEVTSYGHRAPEIWRCPAEDPKFIANVLP